MIREIIVCGLSHMYGVDEVLGIVVRSCHQICTSCVNVVQKIKIERVEFQVSYSDTHTQYS